jgi:hypothetical protein
MELGGEMKNKLKEVPSNGIKHDEYIQDQEKWVQNVDMYTRWFPINV